MSEFFEYDPTTGIRTDTEYDEMTGQLHIIRTADDQQVLDWTDAVRNEAGLNREGIAENWWLYAKITPMQMLRMMKFGINPFDKNDSDRMFTWINEELKRFKTTTGNVGKKSATKYFMPKRGMVAE